ncbi:MlaD family protein [Roseofilum sp. BLCC_M154]|uniref:MlaD family protein n=1 Tax=Roseofilum acuticapitatum BLCC-M154 TaxID=3022444 RepID=A0ABT7AVF9_9CYAN|nr:MlaD family protein [Roseofilum acuticapitatum]MDJ1170889.1 MlaD family protein [Roseofilum acuticapitatum BLCC-M154]
MRQRTIREGSVGLLIIAGVGLFGGLILWLRGATFGKPTYSMIVEFPNIEGMQIGADVRYRGVEIGSVAAINPGSNGVEVTLNIHQANLVMPKNVVIEANQAGLVGSTSIDIIPLSSVPANVTSAVGSSCDRQVAICDGTILPGQVGVSYIELLRRGIEMAELFSSEEFYTRLISTLEEATTAAEQFTVLSAELAELTTLAKGEISNISETTQSVGAAADQIRQSTLQATTQFTESSAKLTSQVESTSAELRTALQNMNGLIAQNRTNITNTLTNLERTSEEMKTAVSTLTPILSQVQQGELINNLETLSANAAEASANLKDLSDQINNPTTLFMLQQTLDSARSTFQNAQKITSDMDDLIGDPQFRENIRNLVNGLGQLVSSTERLEEQAQIAQVLEPIKTQIESPEFGQWESSNLPELTDWNLAQDTDSNLKTDFKIEPKMLFEVNPEFSSPNVSSSTPPIDFDP